MDKTKKNLYIADERLDVDDFDNEEKEYDDNKVPDIEKPYDPQKVDIVSQTLSLQSILDRLENDEIDLSPDFQRGKNLWKQEDQSRLVESILIRIPLPTFYFDGRNDNCWTVVDGLQRISTLYNFVIRKIGDNRKLKLSNLEYLKEYEGKTFEELPRQMQRRLKETQIFCYVIRPGTPDDVTISIFKRINTGGLPLTLAEIRNAVYHGQAADVVRDMADSDAFKEATRKKISPTRMQDRDLATRFIAFYVLGYKNYNGNMNEFLESGMENVKNNYTEKQCRDLLARFISAMETCRLLFGDAAFRKKIRDSDNFGPVNKSLFECTSVCVAQLNSDEQNKLIKNREIVFSEYKNLFDTPFYYSISNATGNIERVLERYKYISEFLTKILEEK